MLKKHKPSARNGVVCCSRWSRDPSHHSAGKTPPSLPASPLWCSGTNIWSLCVSPAADIKLISDVQVHLDVRFQLLFSQERLSVKTCLKWSSTELQLSHLLGRAGTRSRVWTGTATSRKTVAVLWRQRNNKQKMCRWSWASPRGQQIIFSFCWNEMTSGHSGSRLGWVFFFSTPLPSRHMLHANTLASCKVLSFLCPVNSRTAESEFHTESRDEFITVQDCRLNTETLSC